MKNINKIKDFLSGPRILHYLLPVIMIYLVAGTLAQKYIGLFQATKIFFAAPVLWLGPLPLPGFPLIMGLVFLNLCCKLAFKSPWQKQNAGIIVIHIGALLLLLGGLLTSLLSTEGYIDLAPDQTKSSVSDYHIREFVITDKKDNPVFKTGHDQLQAGKELSASVLPFKIEILQACKNCRIERREDADESYIGMARHMSLAPDELRNLDEENMSGVVFRIEGSQNDGVYLVLEDVPKHPEVHAENAVYKFHLQRQRRPLPFSIQLLEFRREMHPGTDMAKSYQSRVLIRDGTAQWESLISMNEPLRYKGYTFYQASFIQTEQGDISVLAVVWNMGRSFPYISGIVMCLGLILHLILRRTGRKTEASKAGEQSHA